MQVSSKMLHTDISVFLTIFPDFCFVLQTDISVFLRILKEKFSRKQKYQSVKFSKKST